MKNFTIPEETTFTKKRVQESPDGVVKIEVLTHGDRIFNTVFFSAEQFAQLVAFGGGVRIAEPEPEPEARAPAPTGELAEALAQLREWVELLDRDWAACRDWGALLLCVKRLLAAPVPMAMTEAEREWGLMADDGLVTSLEDAGLRMTARVCRRLVSERPKRTLEDVLNDLASVGEWAGVPSHASDLIAELRRLLAEKGKE